MAEVHSLEALRTALARQAPVRAADLARGLGVSVATLHRYLARLPPGELLAAGQARRARYGLRRALRGVVADLPVYAIDTQGQPHTLGELAALRPEGCWMPLAQAGWPVPGEALDGWWPGLPYPLYDMQPQGYMGRLFARLEHRALGVPPDPGAWSDDDVLHVLAQRGGDTSGDLIVGDVAYAQWQASRLSRPAALAAPDVAPAYEALAALTVATGVPGSSAAGEFPKFAARRVLPAGAPSDTPHVLVKFSGADGSPAVQRWADLLVCEHLALQCLGQVPGQRVASSRILRHAGRTFLEVERFDRHGEFGRSPLCSLEVVNGAILGLRVTDWPAAASHLHALALLEPPDRAAIEVRWWFGRLIANTDMHPGNLSLRPAQGRLALAPAYDMLPMLHAPLAGGEVPPREFEPPLPLPAERDAWHVACGAAHQFWAAAADDPRISAEFRARCGAHGQRLRAATQHA